MNEILARVNTAPRVPLVATVAGLRAAQEEERWQDLYTEEEQEIIGRFLLDAFDLSMTFLAELAEDLA